MFPPPQVVVLQSPPVHEFRLFPQLWFLSLDLSHNSKAFSNRKKRVEERLCYNPATRKQIAGQGMQLHELFGERAHPWASPGKIPLSQVLPTLFHSVQDRLRLFSRGAGGGGGYARGEGINHKAVLLGEAALYVHLCRD